MNLEERSSQVKELFAEVDEATNFFTRNSKISCKQGCGACCVKPNTVWATVGEMLPMASKLLENSRLDEVLQMIDQGDDQSPCVMFKPRGVATDMGKCTSYMERPMICRLFGSSVRAGKQEKREVLACSWQHEAYGSQIETVEKNDMFSRTNAPLAHHWSVKVTSIFPEAYLLEEFPINRALKEALLVLATRICYNIAMESKNTTNAFNSME